MKQVASDAFGNAIGESLVSQSSPQDPLGDFINEQLANQNRRDAIADYFASGGAKFGDGGSGLRLGMNIPGFAWSDSAEVAGLSDRGALNAMERAQMPGYYTSREGRAHVVSGGDTLSRIAGGDVTRVGMIMAENGLKNSTIQPGQTLWVSSNLDDFTGGTQGMFKRIGLNTYASDNYRLDELARTRFYANDDGTGSDYSVIKRGLASRPRPAVSRQAAEELVEVPLYNPEYGVQIGVTMGEAPVQSNGPHLTYREGMSQVGHFIYDPIAGTLGEIADHPMEALRNAWSGVKGDGKGAVNAIPVLLTEVAKGYRYSAAAIGEVTGLASPGALDREIRQYDEFSGRVVEYNNQSEGIAGVFTEAATPGVAGKAVKTTTDLYKTTRALMAMENGTLGAMPGYVARSESLLQAEIGNVGSDAEALRGLGGTNGHALAESVTPGGSGKAFAGHGVMNGMDTLFGQGEFVVPQGTTVVLPRQGITIYDSTGRLLENVNSVDELNRAIATGVGPNGQILTPRNLRDLQGYQVVQPGQTGPNLTLLDPGFQGKTLNIMQNSTTTLAPTRLSDLLEPNMGCVFWAACTQPVPYIPK